MRGSAERIYTTTYYIPSSPTEMRAYTPILPRVLFKGATTQYQGVRDNLEYSRILSQNFLDSILLLTVLRYKLSLNIKPQQILAPKETRLTIFNKSISNTHQTRIQESTLSQRVSPALTRDQGEIRAYLLRLIIIKEREREIRLRASLDTFIKDQNSYLLGLSGPQPLDSDRLET